MRRSRRRESTVGKFDRSLPVLQPPPQIGRRADLRPGRTFPIRAVISIPLFAVLLSLLPLFSTVMSLLITLRDVLLLVVSRDPT